MSRTDLYIDKFRKMICCETISYNDSFDKEKFDAFHNLLKELFPNVFKNMIYEEFEDSILLTYKVKSSSRPILLMAHHDVVPAEGKWVHEPFGGLVENGKIYGRGTADTKNSLFATLQALDELFEEGFLPSRSIYVESACDEETQSRGAEIISKTLQKHHILFDFVVDEGGFILFNPAGVASEKYAVVALGEKAAINLKFTAKSNGGHASAPEKDSPLVRLGKFMAYVDTNEIFDIKVDDTIVEMFKRMATKADGAAKYIFKNASGLKGILKQVLNNSSPTARALLQTTICFTRACGSDADNAIPEEAYVIGNMRCSNHEGVVKSVEKIKNVASKFDLTCEPTDKAFDSVIGSFESDEFKYLEEIIKETFDVVTLPFISVGATDSRFFEKISKNVFRFSPFYISDEQMSLIHGIDENIDIETLEPAVNFYKNLIRNLPTKF